MSVGAISEISRCTGCISALMPEMYSLPPPLGITWVPLPPHAFSSFRITGVLRKPKPTNKRTSAGRKSTVLAKQNTFLYRIRAE